jgi:DNA repair exonuclease SbcCD ATPase subunit
MKRDQQLAQKEAERAARFEDLLSQRNKLVAGIIQTLATSFDLGERPVPLMGDIKAEGLWQQIDRVIGLLANKLQSEQQAKTQLQQSYQAETIKLAEKEAQLVTLQTTLTTQTSQLTQLERSLEEQIALLKQQQDDAQHVLSQTLEKHLSELARLTELEQQALALVSTQQKLTQLEEQLSIKEALITQLETNKPIEQVKVEPKPVVIKQVVKETPLELKNNEELVLSVSTDLKEAPISPVKEQSGGVSGKLKSLFGRANQELLATGLELVEIKEEMIEVQPIVTEVQQSLSATSVKEQIAGMTGKFKSLFGKANQESITKELDVIEIKEAIIERQSVITEVEIPAVIPVNEPVIGVTERFKNLFGRANPEPIATAPEIVEIKEEIVAVEPELTVVELPSVSPVKAEIAGVTGKLKGLFGKAK